MLEQEEYVEQAHFFRSLTERLNENIPLQELLASLREEILATTKLPWAVDFLLDELHHCGVISTAMRHISHYFTEFQSYVIAEAEDERGRFDLRVGLSILHQEAAYRSRQPTPQGVFLYQFETLCRNRLRYDPGLQAIALDPIFDDEWREWIQTVRRQVGIVDFADMIYVRSKYYRRQRHGRDVNDLPEKKVLFGEKEGRIAMANRRKDPLLLFSALQRHLGYPVVPRPQPADEARDLLPQLARRMERLESRLKLLEEEQRSGIDITKFYERFDQDRTSL